MMPNNPTRSQNSTPQATQKSPMPPKKVYNREFKLETLRLLKSSGKPKAQFERGLGLYQGQLSLWEKAFNREGANVQSGQRLDQTFPGTGYGRVRYGVQVKETSRARSCSYRRPSD